jgi:hypothetical protein
MHPPQNSKSGKNYGLHNRQGTGINNVCDVGKNLKPDTGYGFSTQVLHAVLGTI